MSIVLARIDNRLLHGVVATQWSPMTGCTRLMVIDDEVANDVQKKEVMKFGRPSGVNLSIINEETALNNFKAHKYDGQKVFVVTKKPNVLTKIAEIEFIPKVNIGGTIQIEDGIELSNRAMATKQDLEDYKALKDKGVEIQIQYVPSDKVIEIDKFI